MKRELQPMDGNNLYLEIEPRLVETAQGYQVGMQANGHFQEPGGSWKFDKNIVTRSKNRYHYQNVSFFGPVAGKAFYSDIKTDPSWFIGSFKQYTVGELIHSLQNTDPQLSTGVSFLLGGFVREQVTAPNYTKGTKGLREKVDFVAQMTKLAEIKSSEAVASIISRYLLSDGAPVRDSKFDGEIYHMAEAVADDPVTIKETRDLGLSQVARLRLFLDKMSGESTEDPDIEGELNAFGGFPTVGAEFHFTPEHAQQIPDLWKKLAVLNLSQYHRDSAIQLSRNDEGVVEVRMNPSVYPVTIANWNYLRFLLPELNRATFTITLNRNNVEGDFKLENSADEAMVRDLKGLGLLNYVRYFEEAPGKSNPGQISFGTSYVGQTVGIKNGRYEYRGRWANGRGDDYGQIGIYAGIGDNLPDLAYYLSMALHKPSILRTSDLKNLRDVVSLKHAYGMTGSERRTLFELLDEQIVDNSELLNAKVNGNSIMAKLNP